MSIQDFVESYEKMHFDSTVTKLQAKFVAQGTGPVEYVNLGNSRRLTGKVYIIETNYDKYLRNQIDLTQLASFPY